MKLHLKSLAIALAFVSTSLTATAQVQQSYSLETTAGWNLLGNSIQSTIYVANTFGDSNKVTSVWKWDTTGNKWLFYSPTLSTAELQSYTTANGFGILTTIEGGEGYWVNTKVANNFGTQSGLGVVSPKLGVGWNLVASGGVADNKDVSVEMFSHIVKKAVDVVSVWQWGGSKWNFYAPSLYMDGGLAAYQSSNNYGAVSGSVSGAGKGFWVKGNGAKAAMPLPVLRSSYENKMAAGKVLGPQSWPLKTPDIIAIIAEAFGDFLQDGSYTRIGSTIEYDNSKPITEAKNGKIHFYKLVSGKWVDVTSRLIADNTGCMHPRKAMVGDLNGDGRPDIAFACHGYDSNPWPGEKQRILWSQADGTYKNEVLNVTAYAHGGAVADHNGTGYADIVYSDATPNQHQPSYFVNNKNQTFTEDSTRIPSANTKGRSIYSVEFIDFNNDKKYDLFIAGTHSKDPANAIWQYVPTIFYGSQSNSYTLNQSTTIQPLSDRAGVLDILYANGTIYLMYSINANGGNNVQIESYNTLTNTKSIIYRHDGNYFSWGMDGFPWITIFNGNLVATDTAYPVSIPIL